MIEMRSAVTGKLFQTLYHTPTAIKKFLFC